MKYGFIGLGNMGSAILNGMLKSPSFPPIGITGYDVDPAKLKQTAESAGISVSSSVTELVNRCDVVILAVKPQQLTPVLEEITGLDDLKEKLFISIAAGFPISRIVSLLRLPTANVIRAMPNLNAAVGEAITALCQNVLSAEDHMDIANAIFSSVGETVELDEHLFGAFSAVAGASPAFTFMYMDALAMAGVQAGIPRTLAEKIAIQAVKGSAVNAAASKEHFDVLRDKVCSPAGTTIEGVTVLEENGFKGTVMNAVRAVIDKDDIIAGRS